MESAECGDLEHDSGQPTGYIGEHDEEESDGNFDFVAGQRRGVTRPADAGE